MEVTIKNTTKTLKFNFKALFNAKKEFSTLDKDGNNLGDGAANLFTRLIQGDSSAIPDVIKVAGGFNKVSDDDLFAAIDELTEDGQKIDETLEEMKEELKASGFFFQSIKAQKKSLDEGLPILEKKAKTEEDEQRVESVKRLQKLLNDNL